MKAQLEKTANAATTVESLRLELQARQREIAEFRQRIEQMESFFAHIADALFVTELDGQIVDVNPAACLLLGYSKQELLAMRPWNFVTSATHAQILQINQDLVLETPVTVQQTFQSRDDRQLCVDNMMTRVNCTSRELIVASCHNVTQQKTTEDALKGSEARKTAILDSALDCIVTMDHEGHITEFNPAAERTFGQRREEVIGKGLAEVIIPPSFRERHRQGFAHYLASGEARVLGKRIEMTAIRSDGTEFPVELAITRIPFDGPPSFTGYLRDITDRKRGEEKLRRSEAYLSEAQKLSLTGSFGWSIASDEHYWSDETFRIFEYDASTKITLQMILERIHPHDIPLVREMIALAADGRTLDYECRLSVPGGRVKHVHVVAHDVGSKSGNREFVGAIMDITATRHAEEALRKAQADLAHVSRVTTLGELTASIAHEVNQPLGSVINNANACVSLLPEGAPQFSEVREALAEIIQGAEQASAVITRVKQLVRKAPSERAVLDLRDVVVDVLALARHDTTARRVTIRIELAKDMPLVMGDRVQLQQVLLNLIVNGMDAMSATDESKRILTICGRREARAGESRCLLSVRDAGAGLNPEKMDQLFEAFYTTKPQGMGMGLAISRSIIEAHGGRLWTETNQEPGATFLFSVPAARNAHS
jgi:PAS domain S-box-containing protein